MYKYEPLAVGPSLEEALYSLRQASSVRCLWIDALCIDQSNLEERSRQVLYMRSVYQRCYSVIIWLGPKDDGVSLAFEAARVISDAAGFTPEGVSPGERVTDQEQVYMSILRGLEALPSTAVQHLNNIFTREYFSRCWVIQEVMVGSRPLARCGDLQIPFFRLLSCVFFLNMFRQTTDTTNRTELWHSIYVTRNPGSALPWASAQTSKIDGSLGRLDILLEGMRNLEATDPRDKVYAALGICDEAFRPIHMRTQTTGKTSTGLSLIARARKHVHSYLDRAVSRVTFITLPLLRPDYSKDLAAVYTDLARYFMGKVPMTLDILSYVQHHKDPSEVSDDPFPSWVPKWHEPKAYAIYHPGFFSAGMHKVIMLDVFANRAQRSLARASTSARGGRCSPPLVLDGVQVGVVRQVSDVIRIKGRDITERPALIRALWDQLFPFPMGSGQASKYNSGESLDMAFCKALCISPQGPMSAPLMVDPGKGTEKPVDEQFSRENVNEISRRAVTAFLQSGSNEDVINFLNGVGIYGLNRRVFVTEEGHIGLGPTFVRPGDEVVILWKGRMPYILRRQPDQHIFIGEAYVSDDDIMFGKVAKSVWYEQRGRPAAQYRLG